MYILGSAWRGGYLDYHRAPGQVRIQVRAYWPLERLRDVFLEQPHSLRRLWNYYKVFGIRELALKVRSRWRERLRDRRFLCVGAGEVRESDAEGDLPPGTPVAFVAPCHSECTERVCLPRCLVTSISEELLRRVSLEGAVALYRDPPPPGQPDWDAVAGWNQFSGADVAGRAMSLLPWVVESLERLEARAAERLPLPTPTPIRERSEQRPCGGGRMSAVLFGLGNYAKTIILPKIDGRIKVECIHEVEPTQVGPVRNGQYVYDTCDTFRRGERYDVACIAGYHHTHAALAILALRAGSWAVVEKPIVTTRRQLEELMATLREHPGRFYAGFNMRYNPLWTLARRDLRLCPGEPVNHHCIIFETPLVRRHWYNWPNSRSRIVSNGCHWLDHFLFMNDWARPERWRLSKARNGDLHVSVELENGAAFFMSLTDHGSPRVGVYDYVELRANGVTVRVTQASGYMSEDRNRIIRRTRVHRLAAYRRMYQVISRRILEGLPGDSLESVQRSCELMLALDELHAGC